MRTSITSTKAQVNYLSKGGSPFWVAGDAKTDHNEINLKKSCIAISPVVHVLMSSDVCETERVSSLGIHHLTIMEFSMWEKRLKNSNAFSVILDTEDADKLRSICKSTGMTQTAIIRCAVHNYLPYMEKIAEGLASAETDMASNYVQ